VVQVHQQRLAAFGVDAVDGFEGEAGADEPQLALGVFPQQLLQLVAILRAPHLIKGAEGLVLDQLNSTSRLPIALML
jgi:hypothetical protein